MRKKIGNPRKTVFWLSDKLKGGPVSEHYENIKKEVVDCASDRKVSQKEKLVKILAHVTASVPYYADIKEKTQIESFPVVHKTRIKENFASFQSNQYVGSKNLIPVVTSGSTGTPFKIFQNQDKRNRNIADTLIFAEMGGFNFGEKLWYFKIWSENNKKSPLLRVVQNIKPIDVLNLNRNSETVLLNLRKEKTSVNFLGYVSAFETLCKTIANDPSLKPPRGKITSVITMSEALDEYTKRKGAEFFGCPVLSRYSNIENGILAQQTRIAPDVFLVNTASYLIEIFHLEKDVVLPQGQTGRIVVTDYYNYATPMIRYDTGDIGTLDEIEIEGEKRTCLVQVEGRKLDRLFNTAGELISSYIVYKNMWKYTEIDQYQLIQQDKKKYRFKICLAGNFNREKELKSEFLNYLGQDADLEVEYVHEIPLLNSGKRKKVVNEMLN